MPYQNKWEDRGLHRTFTGKVTGSEILNSNLALHGDPRFDHIQYVLNDFLTITDFDITTKDVNTISTIDNVAAISKTRLKIAILANNIDLLKWVNAYLKMMQDSPYEAAVFSTRDDALRWVSPASL